MRVGYGQEPSTREANTGLADSKGDITERIVFLGFCSLGLWLMISAFATSATTDFASIPNICFSALMPTIWETWRGKVGRRGDVAKITIWLSSHGVMSAE